MRQLDAMRTFEITLTGGEPTIRKGFWELIEVVPELGFSTVTLITNAANLSRYHMDRVVESGISSIRVSIDGTRDTFAAVRKCDMFDQVIANSRYLRERVRSVKILTTVMKTNLANVLELTDFLRAEGFRRQDLILVRAHGRGGRNRLLLTERETLDLHARVEAFRRDVPALDFDLNLNAPYLVPGADLPAYQDVVMYPYLVKDTSGHIGDRRRHHEPALQPAAAGQRQGASVRGDLARRAGAARDGAGGVRRRAAQGHLLGLRRRRVGRRRAHSADVAPGPADLRRLRGEVTRRCARARDGLGPGMGR
jgi:hypothetical protein